MSREKINWELKIKLVKTMFGIRLGLPDLHLL